MNTDKTIKNIISHDVTIVGSLKFSSDFVIDGHVEGEVISKGNLTVGDNAYIKGEIRTKSLTIYGKIEGNIFVDERCHLKSSGLLNGDIETGSLAIEEGACFSGRSMIKGKAKQDKNPSA